MKNPPKATAKPSIVTGTAGFVNKSRNSRTHGSNLLSLSAFASDSDPEVRGSGVSEWASSHQDDGDGLSSSARLTTSHGQTGV